MAEHILRLLGWVALCFGAGQILLLLLRDPWIDMAPLPATLLFMILSLLAQEPKS